MVNDIRNRRMPMIGGGTAVWSFIHVDDAARFTLAAITRGEPGIYNIVDDDPAPLSHWLPALAEALGAKPPRRILAWIARFIIGDSVMFMISTRGASNIKAKHSSGLNCYGRAGRKDFEEVFAIRRPPSRAGRAHYKVAALSSLGGVRSGLACAAPQPIIAL